MIGMKSCVILAFIFCNSLQCIRSQIHCQTGIASSSSQTSVSSGVANITCPSPLDSCLRVDSSVTVSVPNYVSTINLSQGSCFSGFLNLFDVCQNLSSLFPRTGNINGVSSGIPFSVTGSCCAATCTANGCNILPATKLGGSCKNTPTTGVGTLGTTITVGDSGNKATGMRFETAIEMFLLILSSLVTSLFLM